MLKKLVYSSINHPKTVVLVTVLLTLLSVFQFPQIKVDTDPENMLPHDAPVRVFHESTKKEFGLYNFLVLGVVNERHPQGVFNVPTLTTVFQITEELKKIDGVISQEIMALSTRDNIEQDGAGAIRFNWLMESPPQNETEALKIRDQAQDHPMFHGSVVSEDGKALALYVPIEKKDLSYEVSEKIKSIVNRYAGDEQYYVTGLPVAEDQFGVEMFKQMAISAPLAGLVIFLLMGFFFKSFILIIAPMLVAVMTVLMTMGLLIGLGLPVHIMSSMIPIFLMPIAVLDSVHILSELFDKYRTFSGRRQAVTHVFEELFTPMLYTSLTSVAGFFSLSFSPIPPVQVFGIFVALGIITAWVLSVTLIPAYVMLLDEKVFTKFGHVHGEERAPVLDKILGGIKSVCLKRFKQVLIMTVCVVGLSIYGITHIQVNDNPVRWFSVRHPLRVADRVLNQHFSGTYEAYLVLEAADKTGEIFTRPEMLRYIENLQQHLAHSGEVGKTTSLADIVKKIYDELLGGGKKNYVVPASKEAVYQCLLAFENSHKPDDLWHLTTPDYSKSNIWFQLKSGDNKDMSRVVKMVSTYFEQNPPPYAVHHQWAGLTYINVVWQDNMVVGMLSNFLGSFIIVLFLMLILFRSPVKALISMIPLTITILFIYSLLGFFGKDYDMPVAVLSALTLGLSIDFAIHFIQRTMEIYDKQKTWAGTAEEMFRGPGRAIVRNALVVAVGFLPLLAAPLVPYKTVGFFMFTIMAVSGLATLFILPAIVSLNPGLIFTTTKTIRCQYRDCLLVALFIAGAAAYILMGYTSLKWPVTMFALLGIVTLSPVVCYFMAKGKSCGNADKSLQK